MKLIIQLPCLNEEETLPITISCLPRTVAGFDLVEWLVVDDGSSDKTAEVAHSLGVDHVISHTSNHGLAQAFKTGIQASLALGADVIINTDADNQYNADDIELLVKPILDHSAEIVIGIRPISRMPRFAPVSRVLHFIGCLVVRLASRSNIPDAPSGFRAFTRSAAQRLVVYDTYTYTLETIIQAGRMGIVTAAVPIRVNGQLRPSRLISSIPNYILRSALTIIRTFGLYCPYHLFYSLGCALIVASIILEFSWLVALAIGSIFILAPFFVELLPARKRIREDQKLWSRQQSSNTNRNGDYNGTC